MPENLGTPNDPEPIAAEPKRRRRLTIRSSMVGILLLALALGGFGEARRQFAAWNLVQTLGNPSLQDDARARVDRLHAERTAASWLASYLNETRGARRVTASRSTPSFTEVEAYQLLDRFGPDAQPAIPELVRAVREEPSGLLQLQAIGLLGRFAAEDDRAYLALRDTLNAPSRPDLESDEIVSRTAAREVGRLKTRAGDLLPLLIKNLSLGGSARERSVLALEMMGPAAEPAIPALLPCLNDPSASTRSSAAMLLALIGPVDGPIPEMVGALANDPDEFVRDRVLQAKIHLNFRRETARNSAEMRRLIAYDRSLGGRPRPTLSPGPTTPETTGPAPEKTGEGERNRPDTPR